MNAELVTILWNILAINAVVVIGAVSHYLPIVKVVMGH